MMLPGAEGMIVTTEDDVLAEYPRLKRADIRAALNYAAAIVANEAVFPVAVHA